MGAMADGIDVSLRQQINQTADDLAVVVATCEWLATNARGWSEVIRKNFSKKVDPAAISSQIEQAERIASTLLALAQKLGKTRPPPRVHHKSMVNARTLLRDSRAAAIVALTDVSEVFQDLRAALIEYELHNDPRDAPRFDNVDDFMAALRAA